MAALAVGSGLVTVNYNADEWNVADGVVGASISPPITNGRNFVGQFNTLGTSKGAIVVQVTYTAAFQVPVGGLVRLQFRAETPDGRRSQIVTVDALATGRDLASSAAGVAGAATVTVTDPVAYQIGQVVAIDTTSSTPLTAKTTGSGTVIPVNEVITIADVIGPAASYPGIDPASPTVIAA